MSINHKDTQQTNTMTTYHISQQFTGIAHFTIEAPDNLTQAQLVQLHAEYLEKNGIPLNATYEVIECDTDSEYQIMDSNDKIIIK